MTYWYDFADARPTQAQLKAGPALGVSRYVKKNLPNNFELSLQERNQYLSWGLGVCYNAEQTSTDIILQPTSYWHDYGQEVSALLQSWGTPTNQGINVAASADTPVIPANLPKAMNNFSAFAAAVKPYGMIGYAQTNILTLLNVEGISPPGSKHWLPGAISWSNYPNTSAGWASYMAFPLAGMVQMLGSNIAGTDMNYIVDIAHMGMHWPVGSPYLPKPPAEEDDDMGIIKFFQLPPNSSLMHAGSPLQQGNGTPTYFMQFIQDEWGNIRWDTDNTYSGAFKDIVPTTGQTNPNTHNTTIFAGKIIELGIIGYDEFLGMCFLAPNIGPGGNVLSPGGTNFGAGPGVQLDPVSGYQLVPLPGTKPAPAGAITVNIPPIEIPPVAVKFPEYTTTSTSTPTPTPVEPAS